jgi:cellulose synthase/poly-beta-1,6-N-acetylglucosamine synthase-like glycosyltransferase
LWYFREANSVVRDYIVEGAVALLLISALSYSLLISMGIFSYFKYRPRRGGVRARNVEIVIVSKADERVKNSLYEVLRYHVERYGRVVLVVDEEAPLLPRLRGFKGVKLVVVPSNYRRDLVGKGRALQYFVECCADPSKWYVFIDDDNLILDDSFLYEIPVYEKLGYVAANGVLVPRPGKSTTAYIMDWIRFVDDFFFFRFFTGLLGRPLLGLHGDLLIVKGVVLREIGFSKRTLTEDFEFAKELVKRGYKTWQSSTKVSIKSPNSVRDLISQRGRWFKGVVNGMRGSPLLMKVVIVIRGLTFVIGVLVLLLLLPAISYIGYFWFIVPASIYYAGTYIYGVYNSRKPHMILLVPFFGFIEAASRIYGLVNVNSYVVIDKN